MTPTKHLISCLGAASLCLGLAGCVNIYIVFPAAAAEQAADKIIDEVWREQGSQAPGAKPAEKEATPAAK